jgi:hypothetical protein
MNNYEDEMTVSELIEHLEGMDGDSIAFVNSIGVVVYVEEGEIEGEIEGDEISIACMYTRMLPVIKPSRKA